MPRIHPTAIIESNVQLGEGTSVWDNAHIRHDAVLGEGALPLSVLEARMNRWIDAQATAR